MSTDTKETALDHQLELTEDDFLVPDRPAAPMALREEHLTLTLPIDDDKRVWLRVGEEPRFMEIGILVTEEGVSVDIWTVGGGLLIAEATAFWNEIEE